MVSFVKFMGRELVKSKRMQKVKMAVIKHCRLLVLRLDNLYVLLHFSTYKLRVNILWYAKNIFWFLD